MGMAVSVMTFLAGFGGSLAVEVVLINQYIQPNGALPGRYRKPVFWIVRLLLATVAGGLAMAYEIDRPLLAATIGAATPLISEGIRAQLMERTQKSLLDL